MLSRGIYGVPVLTRAPFTETSNWQIATNESNALQPQSLRRESIMSANVDSHQANAPDGQPRVAGVVVTHGHLAGELLAAAEMIIGPISHIAAVSIGWHADVDAARDEVQRAITRVTQQ